MASEHATSGGAPSTGMRYGNLAGTGLKVSRLSLGTMSFGSSQWRPWVLDEATALPFFERATELGINCFDSADIYSVGRSEEIVGKAIRALGIPRDQVVIATKVFRPMGPGPNQRGLSRKHILHAVDASLARLGVDYIDLYQIHRHDFEAPIEETLAALTHLVDAGKVLHIGASTLTAWQLSRYLTTAERHHLARFVTVQTHYNLVSRDHERELIPLCREEGIGIIPWSPLARGFLAGNRHPGGGGATLRSTTDHHAESFYYRPADFDVVDRVRQLAEAHDATPAQIALAWLLHKPWVTMVNFGATRLEHLDAAAAALDIRLTDQEIASLEEPYRPHDDFPLEDAATNLEPEHEFIDHNQPGSGEPDDPAGSPSGQHTEERSKNGR